jgi:GMP synthase-like glutamine amidotransferase
MKIHWLQHVPFEGLGNIAHWAEKAGVELERVALYAGDALPVVDSVQALIVMGGPMGVHDEVEFPWMQAEKKFIEEILQKEIPVLGVCLGAQMIAEALGAEVFRGEDKELGWFPVEVKLQQILGVGMPEQMEVFHWHGEQFSLPERAQSLFSSLVTPQQGFLWEDRVLALQFHLEMLPASVVLLEKHSGSDREGGAWEEEHEISLKKHKNYLFCANLMEKLLESLFFSKK